MTLGGDVTALTAASTTAALEMSGFPCYAVDSTRDGLLYGYADLLCGLPGFTTLSAGAQNTAR